MSEQVAPTSEKVYQKVYLWGCKKVSRRAVDDAAWFREPAYTKGFFPTQKEAEDYMWAELPGGCCMWSVHEYPAFYDAETGTYEVFADCSRTVVPAPYESEARRKRLAQWDEARSKLTEAEYHLLLQRRDKV